MVTIGSNPLRRYLRTLILLLTASELEYRTADGRYLVTNSEDSAVRVFGL